MENNLRNLDYEEQIELPPGFRFHPTDDELITYYLYQKALDASFVSQAIGDVDLNKIEPWDLPLRAKIGEKEWYFFCVRDRKYPTGLRTNRATEMGYWKATGKDKEIFKGKTLVGMKKTLVFYKGRAPKGVKTNWIMHEFRIEGKLPTDNLHMSTMGEWVISKVFEKICGGNKTHVSGGFSINHGIHEDEYNSSNLPQLKDISSFERGTISDVIQQQIPKHEYFNEGFSRSDDFMPLMKDNPLWFPDTQMVPNVEYLEHNDPLILKLLIDNDFHINMRQNPKMELETDQDYAMNLNGAVDINGLWSY